MFVVNPVAGAKRKMNYVEAIQQYFKDSNRQIHIHNLTGKNDSEILKREISKVGPHKLVAVGGDGTVKMIAEIVLETEMVLGIIPAGSANGMARELGISDEINEALEVIDKGRIEKIDVVRINEKEISIHLSDVGMNALLVKNYEMNKSHGMMGYIRAMAQMFYKRQFVKVDVEIAEENFSRKALMVVLANSRTYGTGAVINPEGDLFDGKFEVVVIKRLTLLEVLIMILTRRPPAPDEMETFHTSLVTLKLKHSAYFQVDGEYRGKVKMVHAKILPASLSVMIPEAKKNT